MKSLSSVGLGLSIVFGCLLLALIAELYYLLWWKRRITNREISDDYSNPARELFYLFCLKRPRNSSSQEFCSSVRITETLVNQEQDFYFKSFDHSSNNSSGIHSDSTESELMRLNSISGPPRFLFTIIEETKEDLLESEDGKSRSRSLSDLILNINETPYLTPLASPPFFTPPLTPSIENNSTRFNNLLFESVTDAEFNKIRASPPPKFKFLKDAEEKLQKKILMEESEIRVSNNNNNGTLKEEEDGPFITIIVDRSKEKEVHFQHFHSSSSSQVLPLASSPSSGFTSSEIVKKNPIFH